MSADDYLSEDPKVTAERARRSFEIGLMRMSDAIADHEDRDALRKLMRPVWASWCAAQQAARGSDPRTIRAAALLLINNVFWETIRHTEPPDRWTYAAEKLWAQITAAMREGPGNGGE
jgi:hypothetical protein